MRTNKTETLQIINAFALDIATIPNEKELFRHVVENVIGEMHFLDCAIYKANKNQTMLTQVATLSKRNPPDETLKSPLKIRFGRGIVGGVALSRQAELIDDLLLDERAPSSVPVADSVRSKIAIPLVYGDFVAGAIECTHRAPNMFTRGDFEILMAIAAMTSAKLQLLFEAKQSKQRFSELRSSHRRLKNEIATREKLQSQLIEAQKMEAIGNLTGGIAHDFNNLLAVILGNLELLKEDAESADCLQSIDEAIKATERGSHLTHSMLAFARNSVLNPKILSLNVIAEDVKQWATRVLPANIRVVLSLQDDIWPIKADESSTESALLNLIVNARDAIGEAEGVVTISTHNRTLNRAKILRMDKELTPGRYVVLCVADTGKGIKRENLSKIFEPFFSTKGVSNHSGLGLSTIFGFMKQSGGTVRVKTKLKKGTVFELYFKYHTQEE